jgi:rRNA maturation endonuclease Nob1
LILPQWFVEISVREYVQKYKWEKISTFLAKNYCRRCEIYFYHNGVFCPCCGMQLRLTPSNKEGRKN